MFLAEFVLEGVLEVTKIEKVPKNIRHGLLFIFGLFFVIVSIAYIALGIKIWSDNKLASVFFLIIGLFVIVGCIKYLIKNHTRNYRIRN